MNGFHRPLLALAACVALATLLSRARPAPPTSWWSRAPVSRATLVSRYQYQYLRPLRSWQDFDRLHDYLAWAQRPEAVALRGGVLQADLSAYDLILLPVPAAAVRAPVCVLRDPLGYAVLDPGRAGRFAIPITVFSTQLRAPLLAPHLPRGLMPSIHAARAASPTIVEIYGVGFAGSHVRVLTPRGAGVLLYLSPHQINARLDSLDRVSVEVDGLQSDWMEVRP